MIKLDYKGYTGSTEYDSEADIFYGRISNISHIVTFQGVEVKELVIAFQDSVNDYLEFCQDLGIKPENPSNDILTIKISLNQHKELKSKSENK